MTSCASEARRASVVVAGPAKIILAVLGIVGLALTTIWPTAAQQGGMEQQKPPVGTQSQAPTQPQEQLADHSDTRPAEQVYKNVQVLKGMPADQLVRTMKSFTNALGVRCEFCHVTAVEAQFPDSVHSRKTTWKRRKRREK